MVAEGVSPCEQRPYAPGELVSLWDMLRVDADTFVVLLATLTQSQSFLEEARHGIAAVCKQFMVDQRQVFSPFTGELSDDVSGDSTKRLLKDAIERKWAEYSAGFGRLLGEIEKGCSLLELGMANVKAKRMREGIGAVTDCAGLAKDLQYLQERVEDELRSKLFFFVPSSRAEHFSTGAPFGDKVSSKFPNSTEDAEEARFCLAFGRPTAAVFHLMRVMERAVHAFAKTLGVASFKIDDKEWGKILRQIDDALTVEEAKIQAASGAAATPTSRAAIRKAKRKLALRREAAAYLHHVKDAWRNKTMHPKSTYTQDQAEEIFRNVRTFMRSLVGEQS
jgi:hypothetical protein